MTLATFALFIAAVVDALVVALLGISEEDVEHADERLTSGGLLGIRRFGRVGEVLDDEAHLLVERVHILTELQGQTRVACGAFSGTRVVGRDELVVSVLQRLQVLGDAKSRDAIVTELVVEVEDEALQNGTLLLVRKLRHLGGVLGEQVGLHHVLDGLDGCAVLCYFDHLEAQADALVGLVALEVSLEHGAVYSEPVVV